MCQPLITEESCLIRFSAYVDDCFKVNTQIKLSRSTCKYGSICYKCRNEIYNLFSWEF